MTDEEILAVLDWLEHGSLKGASMPTWEQLRVAMAQLLRERNDVRSSFANTIHHYRCENKPGCTCCACERDALRAKLAEARELLLGILRHEEQYVEHACHAVRAMVRVALARLDSSAAEKGGG